MTSLTRAELLAEITQLQKQRLESFANGTFGGWTVEQEAEHGDRAERLALLVRQLAALDQITQRSA